MPIETASYINGLDPTYPNEDDSTAQGDDHLRLLKAVLKNTFPALSAAVTATAAELNVLDGITATTAELNKLTGVTATPEEFNKLAGFTGTIESQSNKNQNSGYCGLDANGRVPVARLGSGTPSASTILYGDGSWGAAPSGIGTVTSVAASTGMSFATITGAGSVAIDKATAANVRARASNKVLTADGIEAAMAAVALTDAATVTVDWTAFEYATLTITADRTLGNPSNSKVGETKLVYVKGNSATLRTLSFAANYLGALPTLNDISSTKGYLIAIFCHSSSHFSVTASRAL